MLVSIVTCNTHLIGRALIQPIFPQQLPTKTEDKVMARNEENAQSENCLGTDVGKATWKAAGPLGATWGPGHFHNPGGALNHLIVYMQRKIRI